MAVAENDGVKIGSSSQSLDDSVVSPQSNPPDEPEKQKPRYDSSISSVEPDSQSNGVDDRKNPPQEKTAASGPTGNYEAHQMGEIQNGFEANGVKVVSNGGGGGGGYRGINQRSSNIHNSNGVVDHDGEESFKRDMRDLAELLSNLNPMAEEFIPPSLVKNHPGFFGAGGFGFTNNFVLQPNSGNANGNTYRRKKNGYSQGRRRMNYKMTAAQREEMTRRTVYVSDIDQQVTEEQLAALFLNCGQVVDCRVCGDPNSVLHFAFVEFTDEDGARAALNLSGTMLGYYPVRVLPSKTAIAPVNPQFLPRSADEREMCSRTIYCTNIDKKVTQADVKLFFESLCGEVQRLRLLGDYHHSTRIAFVEFTMAESAIAALNCSGVVLGSLPIRVSPSKTPVRPRTPRPQLL